jgi:hypothetical protein
LYSSEQWVALVDSQNFGLSVFTPRQYPYALCLQFPGSGGPFGDGTNYMRGSATFNVAPKAVFSDHYFVIAGDYRDARISVDELRQEVSADLFSPVGFMDAPGAGDVLAGTTNVAGWSFDNDAVDRVEVLVDDIVTGSVVPSLPRPDVVAEFGVAPANTGYSLALDTARYSNGSHAIRTRSIDVSGNIAVLGEVTVTISN